MGTAPVCHNLYAFKGMLYRYDVSHKTDKYSSLKEYKIYNNIGSYNDKQGVLNVTCKFSGKPRITWEFESLTDSWDHFEIAWVSPNILLKGLGLEISGLSSTNFGQFSGKGEARNIAFGDGQRECEVWQLYYLNLKCELENEFYSHRKFNYGKSGELRSLSHTEWTIKYDDEWEITISTPASAQEKFKDRQLFEYQVTSIVIFESKNGHCASFDEILRISKCLTFLFQFASGGYIFPAIIESYKRESDGSFKEERFYTTARVDRIADFRETWFNEFSDSSLFESSLNKLNMIFNMKDVWEELNVCLLWYVQALQFSDLVVVINAIGAAFEKIAYIYLVILSKVVSEDDWGKKNSLEARIHLLCKHIGLRRIVNQKAVADFVILRNESTHAKKKQNVGDKSLAFRQVMMIFEESMLSLLDYKGKYRGRVDGETIDTPRYSTHNFVKL